MSIRDAFENCLVELNKVQAPSLLLDDFVYLFNKAIQQYINIRYNLFETKQQLTDDLRVLLVTHKEDLSGDPVGGSFEGYTIDLPIDYQHMLNCICTFSQENAKCDKNKTIIRGANKMDTTQWSHVIDNYYMKPSVKQPYYYIMNIQKDPLWAKTSYTDEDKDIAATGSDRYQRYGNSIVPKMQIKYGEDPRYKLTEVRIDYLRAPYYYTLTQDQLDDWADNSMIIEFPDYVVYEIINTLVKMILENGSNPRMQSHVAANTSIA